MHSTVQLPVIIPKKFSVIRRGLTHVALEQSAAIVEGKVTPTLAGMLDAIKDEKKASLAVADPKLGSWTVGLHG